MTELTQTLSSEIIQFAPGVLEEVRKQFPDKGVCLTTVPGGETLTSQEADNVIGFKDDWVFDPKAQEKIRAKPTLPTEAVYFSPVLDKGFIAGSFDSKEVEEVNRYYPAEPRIIESRKNDTVQAIVERLPKVAGIRWEVPSAAMLARILANHFKENGTSLLPDWGAWTSDEYDAPQRTYMKLPQSHLLLGWFDGNSVSVSHLVSGEQQGTARVFVVGLPATSENPQV